MKEALYEYVLPIAITGICAGLGWLLIQGSLWLRAKVTDSKMVQVITRVSHFAGVVVQDLESTLRPEIKSALGDGKLTPEEAKRLKSLAMERVKTMLGESGLKELGGVVGIFAPTVESYLSGVVEKHVAQLPK